MTSNIISNAPSTVSRVADATPKTESMTPVSKSVAYPRSELINPLIVPKTDATKLLMKHFATLITLPIMSSIRS